MAAGIAIWFVETFFRQERLNWSWTQGPDSPLQPASCPPTGASSSWEPCMPLVWSSTQSLSWPISFTFSGESAFTTIAPCVLGDLFTDETRSLVYGLFYMGEWMKNFVLASSTPSHSVWQRSWFCSWWGSIRVEVSSNCFVPFYENIFLKKSDGVFESLLVSLSFPPFLSSSSCMTLPGAPSILISFVLPQGQNRWILIQMWILIKIWIQIKNVKGWKWRERGGSTGANFMDARPQIYFLRQKFCPQRRR